MPRTARPVVEGVPYHVTPRGNRQLDVFLRDDDRREYLSYIKVCSERYGLGMLAYSLMSTAQHRAASSFYGEEDGQERDDKRLSPLIPRFR